MFLSLLEYSMAQQLINRENSRIDCTLQFFMSSKAIAAFNREEVHSAALSTSRESTRVQLTQQFNVDAESSRGVGVACGAGEGRQVGRKEAARRERSVGVSAARRAGEEFLAQFPANLRRFLGALIAVI